MFPDEFGRGMKIQLCRVWGKETSIARRSNSRRQQPRGENYKSRSGKRGGQRFLETQ